MLGGLADAARLSGSAEVAIVAAADLAPAEGRAAISLSDLRAPHVVVAENAGGLPNLGLHTRNLGSALGLEVRFDLFRPGHLAVKRWIDLAVAIPLLLLAAPMIVMLALAVKVADPGPAFYRQRRVVQDGRQLGVLKLRTMYADAESRLREHLASDPAAQAEWARFFKLRNDPRILPGIGHFLRRSSLDELPQLWNIVRGEMSLVGPRPFPDYHMASFDPAFQALRVSVPPGLTGLWQVGSRSGGDIGVQQEEDLFYIRNWSLWLDMYILLETVPAVLTSRGAR
jgi:lipopolysaccharide/colanic/teichoic acid biosynthesis glycosyltransferase